MVVSVRTEQRDGELIVVKQARSDADAARLVHEAEILRRVQHPGVVELLHADARELRLRHAGTPISRLGPLPTDTAAAIVSGLSDVVHALHRMGVSHGDIDGDHVLIDSRGRPRLCGFGRSVPASAATSPEDVAALGRLLERLLAAGSDLDWANPGSGIRAVGNRRQARKDLDAAVGMATRADPAQRPSARQLAKAIHAAVPTMALPLDLVNERDARFAALPADVSPTADISWTRDDLSYLAVTHDDTSIVEARSTSNPYAELADLPPAAAATLAPGDTAEAGSTGSDPEFWARRPRELPDPGDPDHGMDLDLSSLPPRPVDDVELDLTLNLDRSGQTGPRSVFSPLDAELGEPPIEPPATSGGRRLGLAAVAVAVLLGGVVTGVVGARAIDPFGRDETSSTATSTSSTAQPEVPTTPSFLDPSSSAPVRRDTPPTWPAGCTVPMPTGPDVDADGCPETIDLEGRVARIGDVEVTIGVAGDLVTVGDWDCDGVATPAVLRPDSGEVFVFDAWPFDEEDDVSTSPVSVVEGGNSITAGSGECPRLIVTSPDGPQTVDA